MEKINAGIVSLFMRNIDPKTPQLQKAVVDKFNASGYPFYQILTDAPHPVSMDAVWEMNGINSARFNGQVPKRFDHDVLLFLDIDCIPLNDKAIDSYIYQAYNGKLVGNIQRTNHIKNNQHVFVAPSAMAISVDTFLTMKKPSAAPNYRGDVAEEYTYKAEKYGIGIKFYMPFRFEEAPAECPYWALKDGMPGYGRYTTFGDPETGEETFWHTFQSFHEGVQEKFWKRCSQILGVPVPEDPKIQIEVPDDIMCSK